MNSDTHSPELAVSAKLKAPYVGLRPYEERERVLFFGRDQEATALEDEILGSALTVLFAPSGAGKSSLLRARVIPALNELEARVVFFDDWIAAPVPAIRRAVAEALGPEIAGEGEKSLLDLARAVHRKTGKGLVVILDQFEQFFLRHVDQIDALGAEIGALSRSGPDAHVVLSLREEYLGRLDAFREHLLTVAQARHRLSALSGDAARGAIEDPLELFQGQIEGALVETLLQHLRAEGATAGLVEDAGASEGVSLPFLQIVCSHLWDAAAGEPARRITASLYERLGKRRGIVQAYVREAMRDLEGAERLDLARALNLLAPKAGVKMAYPIDVLASQIGLDRARVDALMGYLEGRRIVRRREGGIAELFHDAFTDVLRGFIEEELDAAAEAARENERRAEEKRERRAARKRSFQRRLVGVGLVAMVVVGVFLGMLWRQKRELDGRRAALSDALDKRECNAIMSEVRALLHQADKPPRLIERLAKPSKEALLKDLFDRLKDKRDAAAECPGPRRFAGDIDVQSPISLRYNDKADGEEPGEKGPARRIQAQVIRDLWQRLAARLWEERQIQIVSRLAVVADDDVPAGSFVLRVNDRIVIRRSIPPAQGKIAILAWNPPTALEREVEDVLKQVELERHRLPTFDDRQIFFGLAQPWSAPLWQIAEEHAARKAQANAAPFSLEILPGLEAAIALEGFKSVIEEPEIFITEALTKVLLSERQKAAPCLVYAAIDRLDTCKIEELEKEEDGIGQELTTWCRTAAFERMLPRVHVALIEAARRGHPSGMLTRILDRMADLPVNAPEADPREIARWAIEDDGRGRPPEKIILFRRRQRAWGCPAAKVPEVADQDDWSVASMLEYQETPVRVRLGIPLVEQLTKGSLLRPELQEALYDVRHDLSNGYGVLMPGVRFSGEAWPEARYRIDVLGKKERPKGTKDGHELLVEALRGVLEEARMASVTVDITLDPGRATTLKRLNLYWWLERRFSKNDVKLLLRGTLAPDSGGAGPVPPERTIHGLPWLLASLPFWTQVCEKENDGNCLVQHLRETQRARLDASAPAGEVPAAITKGIEALERDQPDEAANSFKVALRKDAEWVKKAFVAAYGLRVNVLLQQRAEELCGVPLPGLGPWGRDAQSERDEIENALDVQKDEAQRARLRLCALMSQLPVDDGAETARRIRKFLEEHKQDQDQWSAEERYWLGYHLMDASARVRAPQKADREAARDLLLSAFGAGTKPKNLGEDASNRAFQRLLDACKRNKKDRCFWDLAEIAENEKVKLGVDPLWQLAWGLLDLQTAGAEAHLERIQQLVERASRLLNEISAPADRQYWSEVFALARYLIDVNLFAYGKKDATTLLREIEAEREKIATLAAVDPKRRGELDVWALSLKGSVLEHQGRFAEQGRLLTEQKTRWPKADLRREELTQALREGRVEDTAKMADALLAEQQWKDEDALFLSALAHLLLNDDDFAWNAERLFLRVDHRYRDYIRLMLWWRLTQRGEGDRAQRLLRDRLLEIPANETPEQRFAEGDLTPWRDRLVRYYLEPREENRRPIFDPLKDKATFSSDPLANAGQSLSSFRCEAFFYDALLQSVTGDSATQRDRYLKQLNAVIDEKCFNTYEYSMASWLLKQPQPTYAVSDR